MDIGKVLNEKTARGQVTGAMSMGIAFAGRETFYFDEGGRVLNPQLRTYRPLRFGEQPEYICEFIETPHLDGPYGARGAGEHGLLGMPAALGNSLSLAAGVELNRLAPAARIDLGYTGRDACMIPYDFEYHRPTTLSEALQLYESLDKGGKQPMYYSGGTEMITLARLNLIQTKAVIDIKAIKRVPNVRIP